ncbi:MAG TPA: helix-turn-helix domain-containing protein, partial [Zeimonas sp.]
APGAPSAVSPAAASSAPLAAAGALNHVGRNDARLPLDIGVGTSIAEAERMLILATVEHCGGHRERAAAMLGISAKTLYNRLKGYAEEEK